MLLGKSIQPQQHDPMCVVTFEQWLDSRIEYYGFDKDMIYRQIQRESRWNKFAVGSHGEIGLLQIKPSTAQEIMRDSTLGSLSLLSDPRLSTEAGLRYLAWLREQFNQDITLSLLAYNRGIGKVWWCLANKINPRNGYALEIEG